MIVVMAPRVHTRFRCTDCGATSPRWSGRCSGCGAWNSSVEEATRSTRPDDRVGTGVFAPLGDVDAADATPRPTGVDEFDRVLGGGVVPGSVTLLSGPPGAGKSTLALQLASGTAAHDPVLYVAAEETAPQIRRRATRVGAADAAGLLIGVDPDLATVVAALGAHRPRLAIVDSIQTVRDGALDTAPGTVTQVRSCAQRLAEAARAAGTGLVLIGHVTKDGQVAGPRQLEHLVDTVVTLDADDGRDLRLLRATKHRFGPVGELGVFRMEPHGMAGVPDAAGLFLADRAEGVAGSAVVPAMDGRRVMVSEVQALVGGSGGPATVHLAQGLDRTRVALVVAVMSRTAGLCGEVFCSVAGGNRVSEPGADLGVAVALASALTGVPVAPGTVVCGELGLVGEVRRVAGLTERIGEAGRLGFTRAIVPRGTPTSVGSGDVELVRVCDVSEAVDAALAGGATPLAPRAATRQGRAAHPTHRTRPVLVT